MATPVDYSRVSPRSSPCMKYVREKLGPPSVPNYRVSLSQNIARVTPRANGSERGSRLTRPHVINAGSDVHWHDEVGGHRLAG